MPDFITLPLLSLIFILSFWVLLAMGYWINRLSNFSELMQDIIEERREEPHNHIPYLGEVSDLAEKVDVSEGIDETNNVSYTLFFKSIVFFLVMFCIFALSITIVVYPFFLFFQISISLTSTILISFSLLALKTTFSILYASYGGANYFDIMSIPLFFASPVANIYLLVRLV
jgi:hypothetical protein